MASSDYRHPTCRGCGVSVAETTYISHAMTDLPGTDGEAWGDTAIVLCDDCYYATASMKTVGEFREYAAKHLPPPKSAKVTLRCNYGSFAEVIRVYAYDPWEGTALVKVRFSDGGIALGREEVDELEAIYDDENRTFADVKAELRKRAEDLLPDEK
jgi:hypothetical protein